MVDPVIHGRFMKMLEAAKLSFSAWIRRKERQEVEVAEHGQSKPA